MSVSTPGVVERASKEISRRIHSLGFKTSRSSSASRSSSPSPSTKPNAQPPRSDAEGLDKNSHQSSPAVHLSEADRLNGNNQQPSPTATIQTHSQRPPGSPVLATVKSRPTPPPKPPLYSHEESASSPNPKNGSSSGAASSRAAKSSSTTTSSSSTSSSSFYSSSVSATTNQARTMGSILKGSVMDKVTHVFNTTTSVSSPTSSSSSSSPISTSDTRPTNPNMGNANNKEGGEGSAMSSGSGDTRSLSNRDLKGKDRRTSTPELSSTSQGSSVTGLGSGVDSLNTSSSPSSAINIPKGAVANGRAKFEVQNSKSSPEKPMRFFGSRSRTNSPMLPVKTPKVPTSASKKDKENNSESSGSADKKNQNSKTGTSSDTKDTKAEQNKHKLSLTGKEIQTTKINNKYLSKMKRFMEWEEVLQDNKFLGNFFLYFSPTERLGMSQVCQKWRQVLYQPQFWREVRPVLHCRTIRSWSAGSSSSASSSLSPTNNFAAAAEKAKEPASSSESGVGGDSPGSNQTSITTPSNSAAIASNTLVSASTVGTDDSTKPLDISSPPPPPATNNSAVVNGNCLNSNETLVTVGEKMKQNYFQSLKTRGFDTFCLLNANDSDIYDFIQNFPHGGQNIHCLILRCCNISDRGLETLLEFLQGLYQLEIAGCNEITEQGLWSSLHPRLVSLTINDCINVADECVCAVTQLLPALYEFNLQAYHVTDSALSYFSPKQTGTLNVLRLQSCWEITNHGIVNIVHTLPNLTVLSLSGCSKVTDDGIELIAENLRKLRSLDVSWCPRVTDAALEYIACDLNHLEELTLDRCVHITDIGIGYISTMLALNTLFLRWCTQIRDFGLQHICGMRSMQILSLAGCPLLTSSGLSNLIQLRHLQELELTNCPGASPELIEYLRSNLQKCLVLD